MGTSQGTYILDTKNRGFKVLTGELSKKIQFENKRPLQLDIVQPGGVSLILYALSLSQIFNEPYKDRGYFGAGGGGFGSKKVARFA